MPDANLLAHFVWIPMKPSDNEAAAQVASQRFAEARAAHYWDAERHFSRSMATALAIDTRPKAAPDGDPPYAWDIYLAYRRGNTNITAPNFWMHQLAVDHAPRLDASEWRRHLDSLLA